MFKRPALSGPCSTNLKKRPPASGDRFIRHACMLILSPLAYMHMLPCVPMLMLMFTPCLFADDITFGRLPQAPCLQTRLIRLRKSFVILSAALACRM